MAATRLDQIPTSMTVMGQMQRTLAPEDREKVWATFVSRYERPIRSYLLAVVRDPQFVDDLYSEFLYRCVATLVQRFDRTKGRFRDYVKTTLKNLIRTAWSRKTKSRSLPPDPPSPEPPREFDTFWRDSLVLNALDSLRRWADEAKQPHYAVLRYQMDHLEAGAPEIAEHCATVMGKSVTPGWVRKKLHEARLKLAELIVTEVRNTTTGEVEDELADIGLLQQCRRALRPR